MLKFKKRIKEKGFTLVELIVAITILAILTIIAYISISGYIEASRDSKRISDTRNISNLIEICFAKWIPPSSFQSNWIEETFSWWVLFKHWNIDENMWRKLPDISKLPRDPSTLEYYKYSTTAKWNYYQIISNLERWNLINWIIAKAYADSNPRIFEIIWNYNGLFLIWSDNKYYSVPSLFIDDRWIAEDWTAWFYLDWKNVLTQYRIIQLAPSLPISDDEIYDFTIKIYNSYVWTWINEAVFSHLDINNREEVIIFWKLLLNQKITSSNVSENWNCSYYANYKYWEHIYNIPYIENAGTASWIISAWVSENNWIFSYTLDNVWCNFWVLNDFVESWPNLVNCNVWYEPSWNICILEWEININWLDNLTCPLCAP